MILKIWSHCMLQWEVLYNCFSMYYQAVRLVSKHGTEYHTTGLTTFPLTNWPHTGALGNRDVCSHMCSLMFLEQV